MQTTVLLWVIAAAMVSLIFSVFHYFHKNKSRKPYHVWLVALRFLSIFCGLLLVINPKFTKNELSVEKAKLLLLVDNSKSMLQNSTSDSLQARLSKIQNDSRIQDRFDLTTYNFDRNVTNSDLVTFNGDISNIAHALEKSTELFFTTNTSVLLFTDGNHTLGKDYEFSKIPNSNSVWPIVVGDTTTYQDLSVSQVNLNKYAFLDNQFPIESVITYQGQDPVSTQLQIFFDGTKVYGERLQFQKGERSKKISTLLTAKSVGVKSVIVSVTGIPGEQNTLNNKKETAIEIIDEKTKVLLVSGLTHPDLGAIKKAIESNEQRIVELVKPDTDLTKHIDSDIVIAYQPNSTYRPAYDFATSRRIPVFTILGNHTDLSWVNRTFEKLLEIELGYPVQEVFGAVNGSFQNFNISDFDFEGYPPLTSRVGGISLKTPHESILDMTIKGVKLDNPLMTVVSDNDTKNVFLFGEDIWKWRLHNYRTNADFFQFDNLFSKLMIYLSKSGKRDRLEIEYQKVYNGGQDLRIKANFYDKTFVQNNQADLTIKIRGNSSSFYREVPMLLKGSYFEVDLSDLQAGEYDFTITENDEKISKQGSFKVLDFDSESQFMTANHEKLSRLATKTRGKVFYEDQIESLIENLIQEDEFVPIQKNNQKMVPLIDFRWLLGLVALTLSTEWFIRKYNGLL